LPVLYGATEHPLPWLTAILNGVEHANFFETRATEYAKAATGVRGTATKARGGCSTGASHGAGSSSCCATRRRRTSVRAPYSALRLGS
jgi:hypothetical protein